VGKAAIDRSAYPGNVLGRQAQNPREGKGKGVKGLGSSGKDLNKPKGISNNTLVRLGVRAGRKILPEPVYIWVKNLLGVLLWKIIGGVAPPSGVKIGWVRKFRRMYNLRCMVETGTYRGGMIAAVKGDFEEVYSVELDRGLYESAAKRFSSSPHVHLIHGDSGEALARLLPSIHQPVLFWLDAHPSGPGTAGNGVPLAAELEAIRNHPVKTHVVLIDDACDFRGKGGYPLLEQVKQQMKTINADYRVDVIDNIICAYVARLDRPAGR
jgi:hypothetical protein